LSGYKAVAVVGRETTLKMEEPQVDVSQGEETKEEEGECLLALFIEQVAKAVLVEEMQILSQKLSQYRNVLSEGVLKMAEEMDAEGKPAKMEKFVDSFRAGWKEWKEKADKKSTLDVFMWNMDCELWTDV